MGAEGRFHFPLPSPDLSGTSPPHLWRGQSLVAQCGALGRPRMDTGPLWVSAPPANPCLARLQRILCRPPRPRRPPWQGAGAHCTTAVGNAAGAVPTGLSAEGGNPSLAGDQNHTRQNINYCCFQSPTTGPGPGPAQEVQIAPLAFSHPRGELGHVTPSCTLGKSHFPGPRLGPASALGWRGLGPTGAVRKKRRP